MAVLAKSLDKVVGGAVHPDSWMDNFDCKLAS